MLWADLQENWIKVPILLVLNSVIILIIFSAHLFFKIKKEKKMRFSFELLLCTCAVQLDINKTFDR